MNDEVRQIHEETFNRIVLGIVLISLVAGVMVFMNDGITSPWFIRAVALLIVAGVAFVIRLFGRLVVASYALVLELVGFVGEVFLQTETIANFIPYLLIPIVVIAGFLLDPLATFAVAIFSVIGVLLIVAFTGQFTLTNLLVLLPPLGLTLLVAFLVAEGKRHTVMLGQRLLEDRTALKERTLEMMRATNQVGKLREEINDIEAQLGRARSDTKQAQWQAGQKHNQYYGLVQNTIRELHRAIKQLEQAIEQIGDLSGSEGYTSIIETAWQKIYYLRAMMINLEEVSQLEHGKVELSYRPVDVARLINEAAGTAKGLSRGKDVEVRSQMSENLPTLQADPVRLRHALLHVLNNAVKYTDQGIIEVQAEMNDHEMMIFVSDTGIGMHREEAQVIFDKFGRGSGALAQQRQGAGLGLAISKNLIELHGGRMWVTSVLGVGSTFYMSLPLAAPLPSAAASAQKVGLTKTIAGLPTKRPTPLPTAAPQPIPGSPVAKRPEDAEDDGSTLVMPGQPAKPFPVLAAATPNSGSVSTVVKETSDLEDDDGGTLIMPGLPKTQPDKLLAAQESLSTPPIATESEDFDDDGATLVMPGSPTERLAALPTAAPLSTAAPQSNPVSQITKETEYSDDDGATLVLPGTPPTPPDDDETIVLPQPASRQTGSFNQPIRRFGSLYIRRFGFILVGLLLVVALIVITLAIMYGPVEYQVSATATARFFSTRNAGNIAVSTSPTPEEAVIQAPTNTPSSTRLPTDTPLPTKPPLPAPTNLPTETPNPTSEPTQTSTTAPTQEPTPTFPPSPTVTLTNTPIPEPKNNTFAIPVAVNQPSISGVPRLSVIIGQSGNLVISSFNFDNDAVDSLALETSDNSRFSASFTGQLLFAGEQNGNRDIYAVYSDGGRPVRLTASAGDDWQPAWSADGRKVAFSSNRTGNFDIYVMDADGSNLAQLTDSRGFDEWPVWSLDGSKLVFVSDRDGNVEIYTMNADGSNQQRITDNPADDWPAAWSPDGDRLVFASERDDDWNLYVIRVDGGPAVRLTSARGAERDPFWSPDGQTIAFAYNIAGNWDIYTLPAPGDNFTELPLSEWTQITNTPADERYPAWFSVP